MITYAGAALGLVRLGMLLFDFFKAQAWEQVGADKERLKQYDAMAELSAHLKAVEARYDNMSKEEVMAEIERRGEFRD